MSNSLFLDPFQDPFAVPGSGSDGGGDHAPEEPAYSAETVPGVVVESVAAADGADRVLAAFTPLDLVDAAGAFLDDPHLWWPRDVKATDPDGHVYFGEGQVLEEGTEGEVYRWGTVLGASQSTLEVDWLGHRPDVSGDASTPDEGSRLVLSWTVTANGGTELTVRGSDPTAWAGEWTAILTAFARFTGGRLLPDADEVAGGQGERP